MRRRWLLVAPLTVALPGLLAWALGGCGGGEFTAADASSDAAHAEAAVDAALDAGGPDAPVANDAGGAKLCPGQSYCATSGACVSDCFTSCAGGMRSCIYCALGSPSNSGGACAPKSATGGLSCPMMPGYTPCPCASTDDCGASQVCVHNFCLSCGELGTDGQTCHKGGVCDAHEASCLAPVVDAGAPD